MSVSDLKQPLYNFKYIVASGHKELQRPLAVKLSCCESIHIHNFDIMYFRLFYLIDYCFEIINKNLKRLRAILNNCCMLNEVILLQTPYLKAKTTVVLLKF